MPVLVTCDGCGRKLKARDDQAGRRFRCPGCGGEVVVPSPVVAAPIYAPPAFRPVTYGTARPRPVLAAPEPTVREAEASWRGKVHWLLLLCMLPLLWVTIVPGDDLPDRVRATLDNHPQVSREVEAVTDAELMADLEGILERLPAERLDGALHARSTGWHWLYALLAAGGYLAFVAVAMPGLPARPLHLLWVGLFTGTLGVLLLLIVQVVGACCWFGMWYRAASDPTAPMGARLLGFLFGVGFCEEIVKMLPVLWRVYRPDPVGWREACLWGMASGAGFGISEGILYSGGFYNGLFGVDAYLVRFFSAVTLHVVLSGACAIMIQRHQHRLDEEGDWVDWLLTLTAILLVPMLLHAVYNTFSGEAAWGDAISLLTAGGSVAWLGHLVAQSRRRELIPTGAQVPAGPVLERTERGVRVVR